MVLGGAVFETPLLATPRSGVIKACETGAEAERAGKGPGVCILKVGGAGVRWEGGAGVKREGVDEGRRRGVLCTGEDGC